MEERSIHMTDPKRTTPDCDRGASLRTSDRIETPWNDVGARPLKIPRLEQNDVATFVEEHKSSTLNIYEYEKNDDDDDRGHSSDDHSIVRKSLLGLQILIQDFNQTVHPYTYRTDDTSAATTDVDRFAQECTEYLSWLDGAHLLYHIDCTMTFQQLHGTLFMWLSYIITSNIPWDVTAMDCFQEQQKLRTTTNRICGCLLEIYRVAPPDTHTPLPSIESFLILFKTALFLTKPIDRSKPVGYNDMAVLSTLFEMIDYTLHHVDCMSGLSSFEFQQFILLLVQVSTTYVDIAAPTVGGVNQMARRILDGLNRSIDGSNSLVQVAISVVSDPQVSLIDQSGTDELLSSIEIFHTRCVLQRPYQQAGVKEIMESLLLFHRAVTTNAECQICDKLHMLDCIVIITSSCYTFESEYMEKSMYGAIADILLHFLSIPENNSTTHILKCQALEGLQNLLEANLSYYVFDGARCDNMTMQRMVLSIFDICTSARQHHRHFDDLHGPNHDQNDSDPRWWYSPMEDVVVGAAEVLVAILSYILDEYGNSVIRLPVPLMMNICSNLLDHFTNPQDMTVRQHSKRNQHIQYLIIHMIVSNIESLGSFIPTYPSLVGTMADALNVDHYNDIDNETADPQEVVMEQRRILNAFRYLLKSNTCVFSSILGRDSRIVGAISSVVVVMYDGHAWSHDVTTTIAARGESNQEIAIELLCILTEDVLNRPVMAQQANLLSGLIRYVRRMDTDDSTAVTREMIQRDRLKLCITQLSAAL